MTLRGSGFWALRTGVTGPSSLPRPAATVAILRDAAGGPEVLLTHRPATMAFGPGLHVFPGGSVDPADADPALLARIVPSAHGDRSGTHGAPFVVAAIREAWEEAGVLLATGPHFSRVPSGAEAAASGLSFADVVLRHGLALRGDWLAPLSRWVTPPVVARRYDTRFFVAWLPHGVVPLFDAREVAAHDWLAPAAALEAMADGRLKLWMPTSTTLQQLTGVASLGDALRIAPHRPAPPPAEMPVPGVGDHVTRIELGGAGGIPGEPGVAWVVGRQRVVIVDPGDPGDEAADAILDAVTRRGAVVAAILVTSADPTCAAGAEGLALRADVPILGPTGARRLLACEMAAVQPGERLRHADVEVLVLGEPGRQDAVRYGIEERSLVIGGAEADPA